MMLALVIIAFLILCAIAPDLVGALIGLAILICMFVAGAGLLLGITFWAYTMLAA